MIENDYDACDEKFKNSILSEINGSMLHLMQLNQSEFCAY